MKIKFSFLFILLFSLLTNASWAEELPIAFTDLDSMETYFKKEGITAKVEVTNKSFFARKPRVVRVTIGSEKYVFIDPKKSGYRKDWAKTLGKNSVPKGYDIDHVYAKSRAKGRFKFVMLRNFRTSTYFSITSR
ncbi:MAG: hypothetical protein GY941_07420 [Planctomycetes bacterium]|nr:hypothetical protein [Planctomycetota bacterium]